MLRSACLLQRSRRNRRGFTLVELLVVMAILGILAAIAVPRVMQNIQAARVGADIANERMIIGALDAFYLGMTAAGPRLRYPVDLVRPVDGTTAAANLTAAFIDAHFGDGDGTLEAGDALPAVPTGLTPPTYPDYLARYSTVGREVVPPTGPPANVPEGRAGFAWNSPNGLTTTR